MKELIPSVQQSMLPDGLTERAQRLGSTLAEPFWDLTGRVGLRESPSPAHGGDARLAQGLGWLSVALGAMGTVAPGRVARTIGIADDGFNRGMLRFVGIRELGAATGLLVRPWSPRWVWARLAGDAMDLSYLAAQLLVAKRRNRVAAAFVTVAGITVLDAFSSDRFNRRAVASHKRDSTRFSGRGTPVRDSITVWKSPSEVYAFWRDFQNLPTFMRHLESVRVMGERRSHWTSTAPLGKTIEWDAEMVEDRPNELIAWRSVEGADVWNAGRVRFTASPDGQGTEVHVELSYDPPGGIVGTTLAKLFGEEPSEQLHGDLRRFKQMLETGQVTRSEATPESTRMGQRPAQASG